MQDVVSGDGAVLHGSRAHPHGQLPVRGERPLADTVRLLGVPEHVGQLLHLLQHRQPHQNYTFTKDIS